MIERVCTAALAVAMFGCAASVRAPDLSGSHRASAIVPVLALSEEQDEWLHEHCAYRGLSVTPEQTPTAVAPAPDANLGETVYVEYGFASVATFACRERPPFYRGEIVLRDEPPPLGSESPPVAGGAASAPDTPAPPQALRPPPVTAVRRSNDPPPVKRPALGYVLVSIGAVGLAAGGVAGYIALSRNNDVNSHCDANRVCNAAGLDAASSGKTAATLSTWLVAGGAATLTTGVVVLVLGASREKERSATGTLRPVPGGGVFELRGEF